MKNKYVFFFVICSLIPLAAGCQSTKTKVGKLYVEPQVSTEAAWIRNGDPIEFENELWYPADGVESFLDSEMQFVTEHQGVQVFIDKVDIRPYERLYTKFDKNKFRFFEKRTSK